ncbi:MAG: hypothetical protein KC516_04270 [Nanoarchaeota archaeon]|nr:hypothetical protein [Nanoarchaeota archaeon]
MNLEMRSYKQISISSKWDSNSTEEAHKIIDYQNRILKDKIGETRYSLSVKESKYVTKGIFGLRKEIKTTLTENIYNS